MNDLISIIIPVYNVESYLDRCITSVLNQTYIYLEIILINDGSTDNSGNLCEEYKYDDRVKVIHQKNSGLSSARNSGIDIARGKYITFIDSDDYIDHGLVEMLYMNIREGNNDIASCFYEKVYDNHNPLDSNRFRKKIKNFRLDKEAALEHLMYQHNVSHSAVAKLYDIKLYKNIRYPKDKICEDLATTYKLFAEAENVSICTAKSYYYHQRSTSIIHDAFSEKRMDGLYFAKEQLEFILKFYPMLYKAARYSYFVEAVNILSIIPPNNKYQEYINQCLEAIYRHRITVIFSTKSKIHYKIHAIASFIGYINAVRLRRLWTKAKLNVRKRLE